MKSSSESTAVKSTISTACAPSFKNSLRQSPKTSSPNSTQSSRTQDIPPQQIKRQKRNSTSRLIKSRYSQTDAQIFSRTSPPSPRTSRRTLHDLERTPFRHSPTLELCSSPFRRQSTHIQKQRLSSSTTSLLLQESSPRSVTSTVPSVKTSPRLMRFKRKATHSAR